MSRYLKLRSSLIAYEKKFRSGTTCRVAGRVFAGTICCLGVGAVGMMKGTASTSERMQSLKRTEVKDDFPVRPRDNASFSQKPNLTDQTRRVACRSTRMAGANSSSAVP